MDVGDEECRSFEDGGLNCVSGCLDTQRVGGRRLMLGTWEVDGRMFLTSLKTGLGFKDILGTREGDVSSGYAADT